MYILICGDIDQNHEPSSENDNNWGRRSPNNLCFLLKLLYYYLLLSPSSLGRGANFLPVKWTSWSSSEWI